MLVEKSQSLNDYQQYIGLSVFDHSGKTGKSSTIKQYFPDDIISAGQKVKVEVENFFKQAFLVKVYLDRKSRRNSKSICST